MALQTLYEYEFRVQVGDENVNLTEILERNIDRYKETIDDKEFIRNIVMGVDKQQDELDAIIQPIAPEWPVAQIARIDRTILRIALLELVKSHDAPPKVVINEAVELAKAFGGENSSKFVNGVLGTALREHDEKSSTKKVAKKTLKKSPKKSVKKPAKKVSSSTKPSKTPKSKANK